MTAKPSAFIVVLSTLGALGWSWAPEPIVETPSVAVSLRLEEPPPAPLLQPPASRLAPYRPVIHRAARRHGIDPHLFEALVQAENCWGDPYKVSRKGAVGLGQLMPETARGLGVRDLTDPGQNLDGAARHLRFLLERPYIRGDKVLAVAAYNAGQGTVRRRGGVPDFGETRHYVRKVFARYQALTGRRVEVERYLRLERKAAASSRPSL